LDVYATMDQRLGLRDVAGHAQRAERLGYTGLLVPEAVHDGLLAALVALEHTRELRVATSVLLAFPRSPMTTAIAAWDLQSLSGGRFELGLGSQVRANLEQRFSVEWRPPVPRMREYVASLRAIWSAWQERTPLAVKGEHYRFERMQPFFDPGPIAQPRIPIHLAAVGPLMTRLAGEVADVFVAHPTNASPRFLREVALPNLARGAARAGREPGAVAVLATSFVATGATRDDVRAERERIREYLGFLYSTPQYWPTLALSGWAEVGRLLRELSRAGRWAEMKRAITDDMLDALVPRGTHAEIADVLREGYGAIAAGVALPMPRDPAHDAALRSVIGSLRSDA
jgi:probable F420-dependent oxidoreductase